MERSKPFVRHDGLTDAERLERFFAEKHEDWEPSPAWKALMFLAERQVGIDALDRLWLLPDPRD